jgi:hypothetical protein
MPAKRRAAAKGFDRSIPTSGPEDYGLMGCKIRARRRSRQDSCGEKMSQAQFPIIVFIFICLDGI